MTTIPAPSLIQQEEWPDADFDLPEGQLIHTGGDRDDDDEDWDVEMDTGKPGSPKPKPVIQRFIGVFQSSQGSMAANMRPPLNLDDITDDDDDEGVSTIKVAMLPRPMTRAAQAAIDEDFEDGFALPSDLTQLSLAPLSLNHRSSKSSIEWGGDKDHTTSSQSSDAYSSLGFADASPSSNSTSSVSQPETETEDDEDEEADLDGLVIPSNMFESGHSARQLTKILEMKKVAFTTNQIKVASPEEDDFEKGLVIDDDFDLSPSRLLVNAKQNLRIATRSNSLPPQRALRPPSRLRQERAKSPNSPPQTTARRLRLSPSPPMHPPPTRSLSVFQPLSSAPPSSSNSFLSPKPGSLRGQKSHSGLNPAQHPTPNRLSRKASLSSLTSSQASGSGSSSASGSSRPRYDEPTAASRAKSHKSSMSRMSDYQVPPTRPSTPSSNPAALRLTMPTQSRLRSRPSISSVGWGAPPSPALPSPRLRTTSPQPPRPPSSLARAVRTQVTPPAPKVLKKPKKTRDFGDGTELDAIDDLPTDRDKESRFRVQPKGYGNRIPGGTFSSKPPDRGTIRRKLKREAVPFPQAPPTAPLQDAPVQRNTRFNSPPKKKKSNASPATRKKPVLIRNLNGAATPKVVGDMKWNPHNCRWEGNEGALREFDNVVTHSTRPALITHLTGSSIGSPVGSFTSGMRKVGNMIFDPEKLCWLSTLAPEDDEPDVFANLADDEEENGDGWESKGGTIRANAQSSTADNSTSSSSTAPSPARSHMSEPGNERGSRLSVACDIDDEFIQSCRRSEERHRLEMKGWRSPPQDIFSEPNRSHLYEIRAVATRSY